MRASEIVLAAWVLGNLVLNVWAFRSGIENMDFAVELPLFTRICSQATQPLALWLFAPCALWTAWETAKNERLAHWLALGFCGLCELLLGATAVFLGAITVALSGGPTAISVVQLVQTLSFFEILSGIYQLFGAPLFLGFFSNQLLLLVLIFNLRKGAAKLPFK